MIFRPNSNDSNNQSVTLVEIATLVRHNFCDSNTRISLSATIIAIASLYICLQVTITAIKIHQFLCPPHCSVRAYAIRFHSVWGNSMFWGFQTLLCQQLICPSHVAIARLMSVTVLSLQTRLCFLSVTSLPLHRTRTRVSVPLLSLQCAIVTWQTLCNDSNSSTQVCDGKSEIGHMAILSWMSYTPLFSVSWTKRPSRQKRRTSPFQITQKTKLSTNELLDVVTLSSLWLWNTA